MTVGRVTAISQCRKSRSIFRHSSRVDVSPSKIMKNEITLQTRREFLRTTVLGGALSWTVPAFLADTFAALQSQAADSATQIVTGKDATILVVLQMAGGNDGINTVVPYANDFYHKARPTLGLSAQQVLKLNGEIGFHGAMTGFKNLYDAGHLAVVQGVGYPNPNRSHFRSTEIWQTASDSDKTEKYGWLGRYFDNCCAGADPTVGVVLGRQLPEAFYAAKPTGICFDNPQNYRFMSNEHPRPGQTDRVEAAYEKMNDVDMAGPDSGDDNSGGTIGTLAAAQPMTGGKALDFIERTALDAQVSSEKIRGIADRVQNQAVYPNSQLGQFAQARRQTHRRRIADADLLRLAGRLRHAHRPGQPAKAIAAGPRRFDQGVRGGFEGAG